MNNTTNRTVSDLSDLLLVKAKKVHGKDSTTYYPFAMGSLQGMMESYRWGIHEQRGYTFQKFVNEQYDIISKELATA